MSTHIYIVDEDTLELYYQRHPEAQKITGLWTPCANCNEPAFEGLFCRECKRTHTDDELQQIWRDHCDQHIQDWPF